MDSWTLLLRRILPYWILVLTVGCQPTTDAPKEVEVIPVAPSNPSPATSATSSTTSPPTYITTKTGRKIRQAERGITIRFEDGWKKADLEFHLQYCAQMLQSMAGEMDPNVFCPCFLDKIQYYYEPIYFKEAYEDQQIWNQECFSAAKRNP